jgi:hypothetical protein
MGAPPVVPGPATTRRCDFEASSAPLSDIARELFRLCPWSATNGSPPNSAGRLIGTYGLDDLVAPGPRRAGDKGGRREEALNGPGR